MLVQSECVGYDLSVTSVPHLSTVCTASLCSKFSFHSLEEVYFQLQKVNKLSSFVCSVQVPKVNFVFPLHVHTPLHPFWLWGIQMCCQLTEASVLKLQCLCHCYTDVSISSHLTIPPGRGSLMGCLHCGVVCCYACTPTRTAGKSGGQEWSRKTPKSLSLLTEVVLFYADTHTLTN